MWFYVYILKLYNKNQFYVGRTSNLQRRVKEHLSGKVKSTKSLEQKPRLIFYEAYLSKADSIRREKYLKSTKGKRVVRQMLIDTLKEEVNTGR